MVNKKVYPRHTLNIDRSAFGTAFRMIIGGKISNGDCIKEFEKEFADYIGVKHALGIGSARKGFYLILKSLDFDENDEIIMPSYTFHALPIAVIACGLKPVFVDVHPQTYGIDPDLIEEKITERTKAIVVTHLFGQPCDMGRIRELSEKYNLIVIEDCAHACGTKYGNEHTGALGDVAIFSFKMGKDLPCFGGGMITTKHENIYTDISCLAKHLPYPSEWEITKEVMYTFLCYLVIQKKLFKYFTYPMIQFFDLLGIDWIERQTREKINMENDLKAFQYQTKLSNLQAAVGLKQLKKLDEVHRLRRSNAQKLVDELSKVENIPAPVTVKNAEATYLYFRIQVKDPKLFKKLMLDRGVDTKLDDMSACSALADFSKYHVSCPIAERLPLESLGIPNSPYLNDEDILYIVEQIKYVSNEVYSKT